MSELPGNASVYETWALVDDGVVIEVTTINPDGRFHPDLKWHGAPDDVKQHMAYNGKDFYWPNKATP